MFGGCVKLLLLMVAISPIYNAVGVNRHSNPWNIVGSISVLKDLTLEQWRDTAFTLKQTYDIFADEFIETARETNNYVNSTGSEDKSQPTQKYRIGKQEFGRIVKRNYDRLKRFLQLEFQVAANQSLYNLKKYQTDAKRSTIL